MWYMEQATFTINFSNLDIMTSGIVWADLGSIDALIFIRANLENIKR